MTEAEKLQVTLLDEMEHAEKKLSEQMQLRVKASLDAAVALARKRQPLKRRRRPSRIC